MENRLQNMVADKKRYFDILGGIPDFLNEYIYTKEMQKQDKISVTSGVGYSNMSEATRWYSSLDHSIAVATIIWHFTHNKSQTLAGLFHDIATPTFKHTIDFMNGDTLKQESTELDTSKVIASSSEIMELLNRDGILLEEVDDYKKYPIADNETPKLSADRLEYTLSNSLGANKEILSLDEVKDIYDDIIIGFNEEGKPELSFRSLNKAKKFVSVMSDLSCSYRSPQAKLSMKFLADIVNTLLQLNIIKQEDLYRMSDEELIEIIRNCKFYNINKAFDIWHLSKEAYEADNIMTDKYCVSLDAKARYIDPLVENDDFGGFERISEVSAESKKEIEKAKNYKTKKYVYSNFRF